MRLFNTFLLAGAAVSAVPSQPSDLPPRFPTFPVNSLFLTQPLNTTSPLTDDWPIICYHQFGSHVVDRQSCTPLINYFIRARDFRLPKLWIPGPHEPQWLLQGCQLRIVSGKWDSRFSMQDVVLEMERVLATCQPPTYMGVGGSAPVGAKEALMYAAFHVQVTGARE